MVMGFKCTALLLSVTLLKLLLSVSGSNLSTTLGEKEYFMGLTERVNWYKAAEICKALGMSLASIESETEKTNLEQYLFSNSRLTEKFWLSANDLASSREFTWISTGNRLSYKNWAESEPARQINKRCVYTTEKFEWAADDCLNLRYFICARPVTPECGVTGRCSYNYNTPV